MLIDIMPFRTAGDERPRAGSDLAGTASASAAGPGGVADATRPGPGRLVLCCVTVAVGVAAGLSGAALALLLHLVQHVAFGYGLDAPTRGWSFLAGVSGAAPWRRVAALAACGVVAGFGWWATYARGRPLVGIRQALGPGDAAMPPVTVAHALLQIVTVGLGSPLGREVAPREVGALLAAWLSRRAGLGREETRVMVACGAGAGLAAVYNVPLAGALFTLEVLLGTFSLEAAAPAVLTSVVAAAVAWAGLGDESQYRIPHLAIGAPLVVWSLLAGPLFGVAGHLYTRLAAAARARAPRDRRLVPWCCAVFLLVGAASIPFPHLPGNGKGPIQLGLDGGLDLRLAAVLLVLKVAATTACLRAGAEGGMLTPGMTVGALMATLLGLAWDAVWPGASTGAFAMVGAVAFLSSSMSMPLTAVALIMEFTSMDHDFLVPVMLAVGGALMARRWMRR